MSDIQRTRNVAADFVNTVWYQHLTTNCSAVRELRILSFGVSCRVVGWVLPDVSKDRGVCYRQLVQAVLFLGCLTLKKKALRSVETAGATHPPASGHTLSNTATRTSNFTLFTARYMQIHRLIRMTKLIGEFLQIFAASAPKIYCLELYCVYSKPQTWRHSETCRLCLKIHRHAAWKRNLHIVEPLKFIWIPRERWSNSYRAVNTLRLGYTRLPLYV